MVSFIATFHTYNETVPKKPANHTNTKKHTKIKLSKRDLHSLSKALEVLCSKGVPVDWITRIKVDKFA